MPTKPIDITVAWGRARSPLDAAMSRWWESVYQDMVPSPDGSRLYFLYDKLAEDPDSGSEYHALVVFDPQQRRFAREIPLHLRNCSSKFLYSVSPDTLALVTQTENPDGATFTMALYSIRLNPDGVSIADVRQVLNSMQVGEQYIVCQWQDIIMMITGPGFTVWRVSLTRGVEYSYSVPGLSLQFYYDAVVGQRGVIYLFASRQEDVFDFAQVHTIDVEGRSPMQPFNTYPDQYFGFPPLRKQCALSIWKDRLYIAGGEFTDPYNGAVIRLDDFWYLDLSTFVWQKLQVQLPFQMIEPRMNVLNDGQCYLWADCDNPTCYTREKHVHMVQFWLGTPSMSETAWSVLSQTNPRLMGAGVDYLRQYYRLPEKFLWRVYMTQLGPASNQQPYAQSQYPPGAYGGYSGGQPQPYLNCNPDAGYQPQQQQQQQQQQKPFGKNKNKDCTIS